MKVGINIDLSAKEVEVLITANEQNRTVEALYQHIAEFDKRSLETLTVYRGDILKKKVLKFGAVGFLTACGIACMFSENVELKPMRQGR